MILRRILALVLALLPAFACAHKPSDSYLTLRVTQADVEGHWDIAVRDLDAVFDLDRNADSRIDWGELRTRTPEIDAYAISKLALSSGGSHCPLAVTDHEVDRHTDGGYLVLVLHA